MERCLEEISATVLDAGEPLSYRTLSIRSQVPVTVSVEALTHFSADHSSVRALQVLVKRVTVDNDDKYETAAAKRDPRSRVLCLAVESQSNTDGVLFQQVYALYNQPKAATEDVDDVRAVATACWAQERRARNEVFDSLRKQAPLSASVKALYTSGIECAEATLRQDFKDEQGEETVSAFDAFNASATKKAASADSASSSFFNSCDKLCGSKIRSSNGNEEMTGSRKQETLTLDMSNVLTLDSDDEEDDATDAPVFVKSTKRIISDEEDEEDEALPPKETRTSARMSRNVKRKLNASSAETKHQKQADKLGEEFQSHKNERVEPDVEVDVDAVTPVLETKRRVLVTKTRINEQGYMVTEKTYEEVELTPDETENEQKAAKKEAAAEEAAKTKKVATKQNGPPKQRDLRSFFSAK